MHVIRPETVINSVLVKSNVPETDYSAWASGTTYGLGDTVVYVSPSSVFTVTIASQAVFTWANHGLANGTPITLTTTGTLPAGLSTSSIYYVRDRTTNTFKVALKSGGTAITTSGTQSGTHTATAEVHKVFESLQAANTGNYPLISPTWWLDVGSTNRYRMFDTSVASQTAQLDSVEVTLAALGRVDSVSLFNIDAANVRLTMSYQTAAQIFTVTIASPAVFSCADHGFANGDDVTLTTTGSLPSGLETSTVYYIINSSQNTFELSTTVGGTSINTTGSQSGTHKVAEVVYDNTRSLVAYVGITDWYAYYFEPIVRISGFVELNLPPVANSHINISLESPGASAACGVCIIGQKFDLGGVQYGASVGIKDYSVKQQDDFGNYLVVERAYSKRSNMKVFIDNNRLDYIQDVLSSYRAIPVVWVGSEDYVSTQIYGFYKDFSIDIAYFSNSICNLEIEGLT